MSEDNPVILLEYHRGHLVSTVDTSKSYDAEGKSSPAHSKGRSAPRTSHHSQSILSDATSILRAAFLPEGFPDTVSPDYLSFQLWDTVQALCSYVRGILTSQAILRGVGVGQQASSPLAAVFTFFVRDLAGMLGSILFAYLEGSSFDACAKQWRLFADIVNDLGMTAELASPLFPPSCFLPIACLGSIARSMTGVAGGATRAALTQHFARRGNTADVSAKEQSQETATTILGMVAGMAVTRLLSASDVPSPSSTDPSSPSDASSFDAASRSALAAWSVFLVLTALHVWANVRAMRCLVLASLNQPRLELLTDRYLRDGRVLTPVEVAALEDLTPPPFRRLIDLVRGLLSVVSRRGTDPRVCLGARLTSLLEGGGTEVERPSRHASDQLQQLLTSQGHRRYILITTTTMSKTAATASRPHPIVVHLIVHRRAAAPDLLQAFVHARCLARLLLLPHLAAPPADTTPNSSAMEGSGQGTLRGQGKQQQGQRTKAPAAAASVPLAKAAAEMSAEAWMTSRYDTLVSELRAARWHTDRVTLPRPSWTAEWGPGTGTGGGLHEE